MPRLGPFARSGYRANGYPYQIELSHGKVLYAYPAGTSMLSLPFVALMNLVGVSAHTSNGEYNEAGEQTIEGTLAPLLMAILAVVFLRTALLLLPFSWSIVLALGGTFGTQIWSTASRVLWSHTWQILLLSIVVYLLLADEERQTRGRPILLATLLSWTYFVRPTSSIPIMAISAYVLIFRSGEFTALAITGAAWMSGFVVYSWQLWGRPLPNYYMFHLSPRHLLLGIAGNLISPSRGLFIYVPSTVFVLWLIAHYRHELLHRRLAVLAFAVIATHTFVVSGDPNWWGGHCYGARLTIDTIPWFFLLAVLGCKCLLNEQSTRVKHFALGLGLLTLLIGSAINGRGAISSSANDWVNGPPEDVDQDPARVWDWSHPQFLSELQFTAPNRPG
jgi:hypothetical protein